MAAADALHAQETLSRLVGGQIVDDELRVTLGPLSTPHRTLAVTRLCEVLTQTETLFPGSHLRVRFAIQPPRQGTMTFPGPRSKDEPSSPTGPADA